MRAKPTRSAARTDLLAEGRFTPVDDATPRSAIEDAASGLIGAMLKSGQLWGHEVGGWRDHVYVVHANVPEARALAKASWTAHTAGELDNLRSLGVEVKWDIVSDRPHRDRQWTPPFMLFSNAFDWTSPVADHWRRPIPLYRLGLDERLRESLWFWMGTYRSTDELFLQSGPLEIPAYRELAEPNSGLAAKGRGLAAQVEEATGTPTFYYLVRYWGRRSGELERRCPGCGRAWAHVQRNTGKFVEVCCEACRLVSNHAVSDEDERHASVGEFKRRKTK